MNYNRTRNLKTRLMQSVAAGDVTVREKAAAAAHLITSRCVRESRSEVHVRSNLKLFGVNAGNGRTRFDLGFVTHHYNVTMERESNGKPTKMYSEQ